MKFLILFVCFFFFYPSYSQTYFEKTYGSGFDDEAHFIENTNDNGYIVTGRSKARTGSDYDIFLLKINSEGNQEWFQIINNAGDDWGRTVRQTPDHGYIVGGEMAVAGGLDYTLAKFDANGTLTWQKRYHGKAFDRPSFLNITSDGGFLMCGYSEVSPASAVDAVLLKTDNTGTLEWSRFYNGGDNEAIYGFSEVDDGYITTGYTQSYGAATSSGFITKVGNDGSQTWSQIATFTSGLNGFFYCSAFNSNFFGTRQTDVAGIGNRDIWVHKFDENGQTIWSKAYGTANYDESFGMAHTSTGEFIVSGFTNVGGAAGFNGSVFRCDDDGNLLWSKTYGGNGEDRFYDAKTVGTTGHVVCGYTSSNGNGGRDIYIIRIDNDGNAGSACSYSSGNYSAVNLIPTATTVSPSTGNYNTTNDVSIPTVQPTIVTTSLCEETVCNIPNPLLSDYQVCNGTALTLDAQNIGYDYTWSTGETTQTISVTSAGNYWVDITQGACSLRVETDVTEFSKTINIGGDQLLCPGEQVVLKSPYTHNTYTYLWSNGNTNDAIIVSSPGEYTLFISQGTCTTESNTVTVSFRETNHLFPNLITKNNDGKNDALQLHPDYTGGELIIVNRWGKTIYQNSVYQNEFDGKETSDGIYYYHYKSPCQKEYKGWLQIISH